MKNLAKRIDNFITSAPWTFAKTYAKTAPHEYLVYDKLDAEKQKEYAWFAEYIKAHSGEGKFYQSIFKYFYFGEHKYWLCDSDTRKDGIMNRDDSKRKYE